MERLRDADTLLVHQQKEWGEILTGFETRNRYEIRDASGRQVYLAAEESGFMGRSFLKNRRPFTIHILSGDGSGVFRLHRPFCFFLHEVNVEDAAGTPLGRVKQNFSLVAKKFTVTDAGGQERYRLHGPLFRPWTFHIQRGGENVGRISKEWSGLGKEMFTDADNFNVTFPPAAELGDKALLLSALFLIDFLYFEKSD